MANAIGYGVRGIPPRTSPKEGTMANTIRIMVDTAGSLVADVIEAIMAAAPTSVVAFAGTGDNGTPAERAAAIVDPTPMARATATPRAPRKVGSGVSSKVLTPTKGMTVATFLAGIKAGKIKVTPQQDLVARIILKKPGLSEAEVVKASGINFHSVSGAIFALRGKHVVQSVPRPTK